MVNLAKDKTRINPLRFGSVTFIAPSVSLDTTTLVPEIVLAAFSVPPRWSISDKVLSCPHNRYDCHGDPFITNGAPLLTNSFRM